MVEFYRSMYGISAPVKSVINEPERQKSPTRVLGGMRVHGSHVKQVFINDELVDVPKIEYVKLLDDQLKQLRERISILEGKYERLMNNHNKVLLRLQALQQALTSKVDRR
jgi:TolA-binding protein